MDVQNLKQRKMILQLQFPRTSPAIAEYDYWESKLLTAAPKVYPSWDKCRNSLDVDILELKRVQKEAEAQLKVTRTEAKDKYIRNDKRWQELEAKELELRRSFQKFHQFVQINDDKRSRALKKIAEEQDMQEKRKQMIIESEEMCSCLAKTKGQFEAKIKDYRIYEDFLVKVQGYSQGLATVNDVIKRYEALMEAKEVIQQKRLMEMDDLDNAKSLLQGLIEEKGQILIEMNSQLVDLISRHDFAKGRSLHWENIVSSIKEMIQFKINEIDGVKLCTWNIYEQMCSRKDKAPELKRTDFEEQLIYIKKTLRELKGVHRKVEKQMTNSYKGKKKGAKEEKNLD